MTRGGLIDGIRMATVFLLLSLALLWIQSSPSEAVQTEALLANDYSLKVPSHINDESKEVVWEIDRENNTRMWSRYPWGIINPQALGDLNGDGTLDIMIFNQWNDYYSSEYSLQAIDGATGGLLWNVTDHISTEFPGGWLSPVVIDYDGDGDVEVFYSENGGWLNILEGSTGRELREVFVGSIGTMPKFLNVDDDGILDIIVGSISFEPNPTVTCLSGRTLRPIWTYEGDFSVALDPAIGDLDGDGYLDVVIWPGGGGGWGGPPWPWPDFKFAWSDHVVALNASSGEVLWDIQFPRELFSYQVPIICDLDNDGVMEVILASDTEWRGSPILTILEGATGNVRDEFRFRSHEDERVASDGNALVGDWDGDGFYEVFVPYSFRSRDEKWKTYVLLYENGENRQFEYPYNNNNLLMDIDGDGLVEYVSDRSGTWYISADERNMTKLLSDRIIIMAYDLDGDGLVELLMDNGSTFKLLMANEPTIRASIDGLRGEGVAYPESLSYNISVTVEFPGKNHVLDEVMVTIGNDVDLLSTKFTVNGYQGIVIDGLDGSVEVLGGGIEHKVGTNEFILSLVVRFAWDYPIDGDSWVSVMVRHGGLFETSIEGLSRYRVEKGIEFRGVPHLTDWNGEGLPEGNWTSSSGTSKLIGLWVVHLGTEDLLVPKVFGLRLSHSGGTLSSSPRGAVDPQVDLTFDAPVFLGGTGTFTLTLQLDDLVTGASSGPPVIFELRVDDEPPYSPDTWSPYIIYTTRPAIVLSLNVSDGSGSGVDTDNVKWRVFHDSIAGDWQDTTLIERIPEGFRVHAVVEFGKEGEYLVQWSVPDLVGNEGDIIDMIVVLDTVPPNVDLLDGREWYNSTLIDLIYTIDDRHALHNGTSLMVLTETGDIAEYQVVKSFKELVDLWKLTIDFKKPGLFWVSIDAIDRAGNVAHHIICINIDMEAPTIYSVIPGILNATVGSVGFQVRIDDENGSGFKGSSLEYMVQPPDGAWVEYYVIGEVTSEEISVRLVLVEDTTILFRIGDRAGNVNHSIIERLNLNELPIPKISMPLDGSEYQSGRRLVFNGTSSIDPDNQELTYRWLVDGDSIGLEGPLVEIDLEPGKYALVLEVSDGYHTIESEVVHFEVLEIELAPSSSPTKVWAIALVTIFISLVVAWAYKRDHRQ